MDGFLRQSTASQVRTIGPFIDDEDFITPATGLTIANTDVKLKKNGASETNKNSGGATADGSNGMYHLTFDATDTDTVGELAYSVLVAGALVVWGKFTVLEEAVYDQLFAASAPGAATPTAVSDLSTKVGTPAGASVSADIATANSALSTIDGKVDTIDGIVDSILDDTGTSGVVVASVGASERNAIADAFLDRNMATGADNGADNTTTRTVRQALRALRNRVNISGGTMTVYKENDSDASWTAAVSTAAGDPISQVNPT